MTDGSSVTYMIPGDGAAGASTGKLGVAGAAGVTPLGVVATEPVPEGNVAVAGPVAPADVSPPPPVLGVAGNDLGHSLKR